MSSIVNTHSMRWRYAGTLFFICLSIVGALTVRDYGMSWDEVFRFGDADAKLKYYESFFNETVVAPSKSTYPALFDLPLAIAHQLFPDFGTRSQKGHVWTLCFGLLGIFSAWRLTALIAGERAGFWALVLMAALPRYYGHMFFNPKDIPLAATYVFGLWALVSLFSKLPKVSWRSVVWVGLASGISMSCRIAGALLLFYFALSVALYLIGRYAIDKEPLGTLPRDLLSWAIRGALSGLVGFGILFLFWPALHLEPVAQVQQSVGSVQNFDWAGMVLMDSQFWGASDIPIYYLPYWLAVTLPDHLILLLSIGAVLLLLLTFSAIRQKDFQFSPRFLSLGLLFFAATFPFAYISYKEPVLYDAMRHVLFTLPPMVCLAALVFEWLLRKVERRSFISGLALKLGLAVAILMVVADMWRLHPYQYIYFNKLSGGLSAAYMRDDTDYWGLSHKEAGEWLNRYVEEIDPDGENVFRVHQRYSRWMLEEALDPVRFEMWKPREGADFFVSITRFNLHVSYPEAELLHVVERDGVPLCFVYALPPFQHTAIRNRANAHDSASKSHE